MNTNKGMDELSSQDLDLVSGGSKALAIVLSIAANAIYDGIKWAIQNGDATYNTTGRGDNNGCTGHQC